MIKILIFGPGQSGSTRLYNLVLVAYEKLKKNIYCGYSIELDDVRTLDYDVILNKAHDKFTEADYDYKILPIRDLRDSAISRYKRRGTSFESSIEFNLKVINRFKSESDFIFRYEDYSFEYVRNFFRFMKINLSDDIIREVMSEVDNLFNYSDIPVEVNKNNDFYKKHILTKSHNTDNGRSGKYLKLSKNDNLNFLNNSELVKFLEEFNYFGEYEKKLIAELKTK